MAWYLAYSYGPWQSFLVKNKTCFPERWQERTRHFEDLENLRNLPKPMDFRQRLMATVWLGPVELIKIQSENCL